MNTSITKNNATVGYEMQFFRMFKDMVAKVYKIVASDTKKIQKLIENWGQFQGGIIELAKQFSHIDLYVNEEVASIFVYPSGYKPKCITEQTNCLRELLPGIGSANEKLAELPLPQYAEGYFAIPRWQLIAPTYGEAVEKVFGLIKKTRNGKFCNVREDRLGPQYLRKSQKTAEAFKRLGDEQKDFNILIVPAQFGLRHRGCSIRRANEIFVANEFGLGAFEIACMILTHHDRLANYNDLYIDCSGDEYSISDNSWYWSPCFSFFGVDEVWFHTDIIGRAYCRYGSASGFLPTEDSLLG